MSIYIYKAVDSKGKVTTGELEAFSETEVSSQLAKSGYLPLSISFKGKKPAAKLAAFSSRLFKKVKKVNPRSLVVFTREFTTIIKAAVPMVEGLGVLAEQTEDRTLKEALNQIVHDIEGGSSLSVAMSKHPGVFSELYINTVMAGESAGVLEKVLLRLSDVLESDQETRTNIQSALLYPVMTIIMLFVAVFVLSAFVIPKFAQVYISAGVVLPLPTQIMILVSKLTKDYWYISFPVLIGMFFLFYWFINTKSGRFLWDGLKFKFVVIGGVYTKITMLRFASMLGVLYQAGLPVLKTMDIVGATIGNAVLTKEIEAVKRDVADGKGISGAVLNSKFFPRLVGYMISVGEKSGSLPTMLDSLCDYYSLEVKTSVRNLTTLIEPILITILAVVVFIMILAIVLPMWGMIAAFRGGG